MTASLSRTGIIAAAAILACVSTSDAQSLEVAPVGGYRFGNDFFELLTAHPVDADGASTLGIVIDVPLWDGLQVEGLFTRQRAHITTPTLLGQPQPWTITVDQWQAGGLRELGGGPVRPFLTGLLGVTRFALGEDGEWRFAVGAGGGVKMFPVPRIGVRLDGRLFATFVDGGARTVACTAGPCFVALDLDVVWQAEFTAGLVVALR